MTIAQHFDKTIRTIFDEVIAYADEKTAFFVANEFFQLTVKNNLAVKFTNEYHRPSAKETVRPCLLIKFPDDSSVRLFYKVYRDNGSLFEFFDLSKTIIYNWLGEPIKK